MGKSVLIIEDDLDSRDLMQRVFELYGHTSVAAGSLQEASALLASGISPDLIISDLGVPDADSDEKVIEHLKALCPRCPIVLVSGNANLRAIAKKHDVKFLMKPVSIEEIGQLLL